MSESPYLSQRADRAVMGQGTLLFVEAEAASLFMEAELGALRGPTNSRTGFSAEFSISNVTVRSLCVERLPLVAGLALTDEKFHGACAREYLEQCR